MPSRGAPDGSPPKLLAREADAAYSQSVEEAEPALSFPHRQNNGLKFPRCHRRLQIQPPLEKLHLPAKPPAGRVETHHAHDLVLCWILQ